MSSIHVHEVLEMMITSEQHYSTVSLSEPIAQRFGPDTRFHTCSAQKLTTAELVAFLSSKRKFIHLEDNSLTTSASKICQH